MGLRDIYQDVRLGRGMFSPLTPFRKERRLARIIGPAAVRAYGLEAAAGVRGLSDVAAALTRTRGTIAGQRIAERGATERRGMMEAGALSRQELINLGNKIIEKMRQTGLGRRQAARLAAQEFEFGEARRERRDVLERLEARPTGGGGGTTYTPGTVWNILGETEPQPTLGGRRTREEEEEEEVYTPENVRSILERVYGPGAMSD